MVIDEVACVEPIAQLVTGSPCDKITLGIGQFRLGRCVIILARGEQHQIVCWILLSCIVLRGSSDHLIRRHSSPSLQYLVWGWVACLEELLVGALVPACPSAPNCVKHLGCVKSLILAHFLLHDMLHDSRIKCLTSLLIGHVQFFRVICERFALIILLLLLIRPLKALPMNHLIMLLVVVALLFLKT